MARNKPTTDELPKYEVIEYNGQQARRYADGSIRNDKGVYLQKPPYLPEITTANARDMVRLREEKRIRLYNAGANRVVEDVSLIREYGEDAHMVERAMTLQRIASTPEAGKAAVMADAELRKAQTYDPKQFTQQPSADAPVTLALVDLLGAITRRLGDAPVPVDIIDAGEEVEDGGGEGGSSDGRWVFVCLLVLVYVGTFLA